MQTLNIGPNAFEWGTRTYLMGILNITPDSFSGDGLLPPLSPFGGEAGGGGHILTQARRFIDAGANILDVGGESTRPGARIVSAEEEKRRVVPIIDALAREFPATTISIDTYKADVAEAAFEVGARILNDVWGLRADPHMAALAARRNIPVILMHNRSKPSNAQAQEQLGGRYVGVEYQNLVEDVKAELMESVQLARAAGIPDERIILDPGIGFGKTVEQNLELLNRLDEIRALGFPVLLGPSRKSFIGYTLDLPPDQRLEGTAAAVSVGITRGADIVRVHDVEVMARVARMTDAIVRH
jgi:dihydropteroate synthase